MKQFAFMLTLSLISVFSLQVQSSTKSDDGAKITFDKEVGHSGSSKNLIGERPPQSMINLYSNDKQVTAETPPTYLVHAKDDPVKIENSYLFEAALKQNNVPVAHTYYEKGGHGYGMINPTSEVRWMDDVEKWMKAL